MASKCMQILTVKATRPAPVISTLSIFLTLMVLRSKNHELAKLKSVDVDETEKEYE